MTRRDVVVVGAGVVGLSCALELAERGHSVRMVAADPLGEVSPVAASLWAPSHVERSERVRSWAYATLARLRRDASPAAGVREQLSRTVGLDPWSADPWMRGFAPVIRQATAAELPAGYRAGTVSVVPLVDTSRYLPWLHERRRAAGIPIARRALASLADAGAADVVVLAAGLGARGLAGDDALRPVRTQVVRVADPGLSRTTIVRDGPLAPLFVVPRFDDVLIGGAAEPDGWDPHPDPEAEAALLARAAAVEPALAGARVLGTAVGLRPVRESVRVEHEILDGRSVVHCYGHGGAGIALSWGSAQAAADLVAAA